MASSVGTSNIGLFQTSYSTGCSLLVQGFNLATSTAPPLSSNLFNNLNISSSTASTCLLQASSSSLSYQVNLSTIFTSLGQTSSTTHTQPVPTSLGSFFKQFPTDKTNSSMFSTPVWPTTTSSEMWQCMIVSPLVMMMINMRCLMNHKQLIMGAHL